MKFVFGALVAVVMVGSQAAQAMHIYANYDCSNAKFDLKYDGPGSNMAYGGYANLYSKKLVDGKKVNLLSYESDDAAGPEKIGDEIGEQKLEMVFEAVTVKDTTKPKTDIKVGDACTADEYDLLHSDWKSVRVIRVRDLSSAGASSLNLRVGDLMKFRCDETMDMPIKCPASGRWDKASLGQ